MGTYVVTSEVDDSSIGSLRWAMEAANDNPGSTIAFNIGEGGNKNIYPISPLPEMLVTVEIDGATQPGYTTAAPCIRIDGQFAGQCCGIVLRAENSLLQAVSITQFAAAGVVFNGGGWSWLFGCYIGTDQSGMIRRPNGGCGLEIHQSPGNVIGGAGPAYRNVISGNNLYGIIISGDLAYDNVVRGNFVGTNRLGTGACKNMRSGILVFNAPRNWIGSYDITYRNVISGNERAGVNLDGSVPDNEAPHAWKGQGHCNDNRVIGNFIGTDPTGMFAVPNGLRGVLLHHCQGNHVGGSSEGALNVISGNLEMGVKFQSPPSHSDMKIVCRNNHVVGNYIGVGFNGTKPLGNASHGIDATNSRDNVIGNSSGHNIIANNGGRGIRIVGTGAATNSYGANTVYNNALTPEVVVAA